MKFCKSCGAHLYAIRQVMDFRETDEKINWGKTWIAEMFLSHEEQERRKAEIERQRGITPEVKRYNEIKAGVITSSLGVGLAIFLYVFMRGIILSGNVPPDAAEIISRIWVAGVIPLFVGIALIINGLLVSKRLVENARQLPENYSNALQGDAAPRPLAPADTTEFIPSTLSVTEHTTKHLSSSGQDR
ncbi:MAG TPA: hypothetical protein VJ124_02455 [Pyrinomonadaceae bacterium]|nr:hypothetical protein [Pyrinomonadaceae bacterium]